MRFTTASKKESEYRRAASTKTKEDLLLCVRPLINQVNGVVLKFFDPGKNLCVDEGGAANDGRMPREVRHDSGLQSLPWAWRGTRVSDDADGAPRVCVTAQLYHDRRGKPIPKGFNIIILCDNSTRLPLGFYIVDKRDKLNATQMVEKLVSRLRPNHYHVYTDRVRGSCDNSGVGRVRRALTFVLRRGSSTRVPSSRSTCFAAASTRVAR